MSLKKHIMRGGVIGFCVAAVVIIFEFRQLIFTVSMSLLEQMIGRPLQIATQYQWMNQLEIMVIVAVIFIIYGIIGGLGYGVLRNKSYSEKTSIIGAIILMLVVFSILLTLRMKIALPAPTNTVPTAGVQVQ